jgi:hypothetical protein
LFSEVTDAQDDILYSVSLEEVKLILKERLAQDLNYRFGLLM